MWVYQIKRAKWTYIYCEEKKMDQLEEKTQIIKKKAVFLDRDGTIIYDRDYLRDPELVELIAGVVNDLRLLRKQGYLLVLVSNQSGIARGYFTQEDLAKVNKRFMQLLEEQGVTLDGIYYCPHGPGDGCDCRKPAVGMALAAERDLNIDLSSSYMVGDKLSDIQFGENFGARTSFYSVREAVEYITRRVL